MTEEGQTASMKSWQVDVLVMPKDGVNDPEGEAIKGGLISLGYEDVDRVRSGKHYRIVVRAESAESARDRAMSMADRLLANPVIQTFLIESVSELEHPA